MSLDGIYDGKTGITTIGQMVITAIETVVIIHAERMRERERVISTAKPILYIKSSNRKSQMESDFHVSLTFWTQCKSSI